jgi:hypothetical protein
MSVRYRIYQLARRVSRLPLVRSLIPSALKARMNARLGGAVMDEFADRRYMEEAILPAVAALRPRVLLDVGLQPYTAHYGRFFGPETERWTLDVDPASARLGVPGRHIEADALDVESRFAPGSLDVLLFNGILGFGLDRLDDEERMLRIAHRLLRADGWLLVGWDRTPAGELLVASATPPAEGTRARDPLALDAVRELFVHAGPGGLPARRVFDDSSHVYDWFRPR